MRDRLVRKGLVFGIILLLAGSTLIPSITGYSKNPLSNENLLSKKNDNLENGCSLGFEVEWMRIFGGSGTDYLNRVEETSDGGFILSGFTESYSVEGWDIWTVKTDIQGFELWNKTYSDGGTEYSNYVEQTNDGGYIIGGQNSYNGWLIKTNTAGDIEWEIGTGIGGDSIECVHQTPDGGFISVYEHYSDIRIIKHNISGSYEWDTSIGGNAYDRPRYFDFTDDGGLIIVGYTKSYGMGENDLWLIKTNQYGQEEWNKTFGGSQNDYGHCVEQTNDGGYIITGDTFSYGSYTNNFWVIKTDQNGNEIWNKTYGDGFGNYIDQTNEGYYVLTGSLNDEAAFLLINSEGALLLNETLQQSGTGHCVRQTSDGKYILVGVHNWDPRLYKIMITENNSPNKPDINGPTSGKVGETYTYTFVAIDSNNDDIYYQIDWGDGIVDDWYGPVGSNVIVSRNHIWNEKGDYIIKARAKDIHDAIGEWGTLEITMPLNQVQPYQQIPRFIQNHPNLFPILQRLLGL